MHASEVECLMSQSICKPFWMKKTINNNVCEVRSICMQGIFEKYSWVHVPIAVVFKTRYVRHYIVQQESHNLF